MFPSPEDRGCTQIINGKHLLELCFRSACFKSLDSLLLIDCTGIPKTVSNYWLIICN